MDSFLNSKFMLALQKGGQKLSMNKAFSAVSAGMQSCITIIMVGALFQILGSVPVTAGFIKVTDPWYVYCMVPYNLTMGLISIYVCVLIAYQYACNLKVKPIQAALSALAVFFIVASPATVYSLAQLAADGTNTTVTALDVSALGSQGMFGAIVVALCCVKVESLCVEKHIVIHMSDAVRQFLQDSFSALVPFFFNVVIWGTIGWFCEQAAGTTLPLAIEQLLALPLAGVNSVPGMMLLLFFATALWCFGIHGTMVAVVVIIAITIQNTSSNAALVAAGMAPIFYPTCLWSAIGAGGGTGNTLPLCIMCMRSKSEQLKAIGKVGLIPGIFNVNEPITFGVPVMYNPLMAVPYILNVQITLLLMWAGFSVGFFQPNYIFMQGVFPLGVGEFLQSMAWQNAFIPVLAFVVAWIVYRPFFKAYEKTLVEQEAAALKEEEAEKAAVSE